MSGGGGGMLGPAMARFTNQQQGQNQGGAGYTPAQTRSTYNPAFSSQQTAQPVIQGLPQQMVPQAPQQQGLQNLMSQMMSRYQSPYQMQQRQMPMQALQQQSRALQYRPNMANAQQALTRVKPSVYKTDLDTARARIAELEGLQQPSQDPYYYGGG
jgi:hypothetical protein